MGSIIYFLLLGFVFPGHSVPLSPRTRVPEKSMAPIIHVYPPIPGNSLILNCFIRGFPTEDVDIQWLKNGQAVPENEYVNTPAVKEKSGDSHFLYSKLTIPESSWQRGNMFTCMVVHEGLETKFTLKSIEKTLEKSMAPIIHVYASVPGNSLILTCFVCDFVPIDFDIQWLKNGQAIPENEYVNTPAVKEKSGDTHFAYSKLTISESSLDEEALFSCMVVQEGL